MNNYKVKLKINKSLTEKDKLKEVYRSIKKLMIGPEISDYTAQIKELISETTDVDLNIAIPQIYFDEAMEIRNIEKLHEAYKKKYEAVTKDENQKRTCFSDFHKMLD